jgi:hypothetical protein
MEYPQLNKGSLATQIKFKAKHLGHRNLFKVDSKKQKHIFLPAFEIKKKSTIIGKGSLLRTEITPEK